MSREEESPRKATSVSRSHHNGGFSKHKWLLGGKEKRRAQNLTFTPSLGIVLSVSVIGAVVARFVHTEEVAGSNPVSPTLVWALAFARAQTF